MIKEKLEHYLQTESFFPLTTKLSDVTVLVKFENNLANILQIIDYAKELYLDKEQYEERCNHEIADFVFLHFVNCPLSMCHISTNDCFFFCHCSYLPPSQSGYLLLTASAITLIDSAVGNPNSLLFLASSTLISVIYD